MDFFFWKASLRKHPRHPEHSHGSQRRVQEEVGRHLQLYAEVQGAQHGAGEGQALATIHVGTSEDI